MTLFLNEQLLQYIWQYQFFNTSEMRTSTGEPLRILHPGTWNTNQGPDFQNARIQIGETIWAGTVELHRRSSDWNRHEHTGDEHYQAVVLHVVWENDVVVNDIPIFELQGRVPGLLLERYEQLLHQAAFIPCEDILQSIPDLLWQSWRERLLMERLLRRKNELDSLLQQTQHNWEEVCWWMLARNFGMRLNAEAFEAMARSIPYSLIGRNRHQLPQLEALLMGMAGLLRGRFHDAYPKYLQKEFQTIIRKTGVQPISTPCVFLRMRPMNFPGIRLAQLARLLQQSFHLFAAIRDSNSVKEIRQLVNVQASEYWDTHYRFDESSTPIIKQVGDMLADNIVVNTAIPLLFTYAQYLQDQRLLDKALHWLEEIKAEKNNVVHSFQLLGFPVFSSADSQALLELKRSYCEQHKCLDCALGNFLLKNKT